MIYVPRHFVSMFVFSGLPVLNLQSRNLSDLSGVLNITVSVLPVRGFVWP